MRILKRTFLFLLLVPAVMRAQQDSSFFFVQLADPQFGMFPFQKDFHKERVNLGLAVEAINRLKPAFVVVCGDFVNKKNDRRQIEAFRETLSRLDKGIPVYLVPGNHDVGNVPTTEALEEYRRNFGPDYYSFSRGGWTFIVLNSSLMKAPAKAEDLAKAQEQWFAAALDSAKSGNEKVIVFQHHPWFVAKPDEPNGYFNMPRNLRRHYLGLLASDGVSYVFAGHLHQNASGQYRNLSMVTTGPVGMPLGTSPSGLRVVTIRGNNVEHRYYALRKVPARVDIGRAAVPGRN
ncbi:MAG TPA: metallophosphoesterase [Bacteroidota bacterium]|nr:metallophosphoesterase [Bacteroidota bacterium]